MDSDDENILVINRDANDSTTDQPVQRQEGKLRKCKLEPALLLLFFAWNLASSIIPNQLLRETCLNFGYNTSDCDNLNGNNETKHIEESIQPYVAEILMTISLLNSIIPAILSLFLGPWTDKFGRKKVICATFIGFSTTLACLSIVAYIADQMAMMNPWAYVIAYIPLIVTGGWPTMIVSILCYTTDLTTEAFRSTRLAIIEMIIFMGVVAGTASSSYILNWTSPVSVFLIAMTCAMLATIHTIIFVDESVPNVHLSTAYEQLKELISHAPVVEMLKTCFKRRPFQERRILWCLIMILMFTVFALNGQSNVFYLFVREKFNWSLKEATLFDSTTMMITIVGCIVGMFIFKRLLNFSDLTIAFIAIVSVLLDSSLKAFAQTPLQIYIAAGICWFKVLCSPMCRSLISSIIPSNEIGKVYSIASSFEAVSSLIASPLYTYIYSQTFTFFAGAFYFITAGVYIINLILAYCVLRMKRTRENLMNPYSQIDNS